jgi:hypothetical protein
MTLEIYRQILEKYSNIKFMKIRIVGAELFHEDGQIGEKMSMKKLFIILQIRLKTKKDILCMSSNIISFFFFFFSK